MNNMCMCSAIVLLQDVMPLVSSMDICPGTQPTQYYQSWRLGYETKHNSPEEYCRPQTRFPTNSLPKGVKEAWQLANFTEVDSHKVVECRPEIKFYTKGWCAQRNQKLGHPYPRRQCWVTLVAPLMQGIPNVISVEPLMALQKQGEQSHPKCN